MPAQQHSEQRFRAIFEGSNVGMAMTTTEGRFLEVNPALVRMLGYPETELVTMTLWELVLPADRPLDGRTDLLASLSPKQLARRLLTAEHQVIRVRLSASLLDGAGSNEDYAVLLVEDVTRELQLEEQYLQAQKMEAIGRLAGGIAHDFNNLLTGILGHVAMATSALEDSHPAYEDVHEIELAAERATNLTRQLLAFARKQIHTPRVHDLGELVVATSRMLRRMIGEDIELAVTPADGLWPVRVDKGQIEQVLLNLAVNASDAMPRGGKLSLAVENVTFEEPADEAGDVPAKVSSGAPRRGDYVVLTVSDTGIGMSPEVMEHAFEPFFTTKDASRGTGLGLATCFGIVEQSGGWITVESQPGVGSTFRIHLPRGESREEPLRRPNLGELPGGTETILVVEDEPRVRRLVVRLLRQHGYEVVEASDGEDALSLLDAPDRPEVQLLLTDVVMPRVGGRRVAERMRSLDPRARVIFTSGYADDSIVRMDVAEERIEFLQKPFSPRSLLERVRAVLDRPPPPPPAEATEDGAERS